MVLSVTAIPIEPVIRSGFRPIRSMSNIATTQAPMLTAPLITLISRASLSEKPADCQRTAP